MSHNQMKFIQVKNLKFDPKNPRFAAAEVGDNGPQEIVNQMIDSEQIIDLINSIGTQGYFPGEPLLVFPDPQDPSTYFVAEGNRRLSALKILNRELESPRDAISILVNEFNAVSSVPCITFPNRDSVLHYLGYKHITGVKAWGSLEKAIYLKQLFDKNNKELKDETRALSKLAKEIGSNIQTIKKTLSALNIYHKNYDSRKDEFFGLQRVGKDDIQFSLLYTAIGFPYIAKYIGLENGQDFHLLSLNYNHTKELFSWLFSQDDNGRKAVPESRKISTLNSILSSADATRFFKDTRDLDAAYKFTNGPQEFFNSTINAMEKNLEEIARYIRNDTFLPDDNAIKKIEKLLDFTDDVLRIARRAQRDAKEHE